MTVYGKLLRDVIEIISLSLGLSCWVLYCIKLAGTVSDLKMSIHGDMKVTRAGFEIITPERREIILSVLCRCDFPGM